MSQITYEAAVYSRIVKYTNFKGNEQEVELFFALDPLKLMEVIASFVPKKNKSRNPALAGKEVEITEAEQIRLVRDLAVKSAGFPSDDGESWEPFEDFENSLVGKAFMTRLLASDGDRKTFAEQVILAPFRAFVNYASVDESNSPAEVKQFRDMVTQLENIFKAPAPEEETYEQRRARLEREIEALGAAPDAEA